MTWIGSSHPSWWRTKVWSNIPCPVVHNITPLASLGTVAMTSTPSETEEKQFFSYRCGHRMFLCGLRLCSTVSVVCVISMRYIKWKCNVKLTASLSICMFHPLSHLKLNAENCLKCVCVSFHGCLMYSFLWGIFSCTVEGMLWQCCTSSYFWLILGIIYFWASSMFVLPFVGTHFFYGDLWCQLFQLCISCLMECTLNQHFQRWDLSHMFIISLIIEYFLFQ